MHIHWKGQSQLSTLEYYINFADNSQINQFTGVFILKVPTNHRNNIVPISQTPHKVGNNFDFHQNNFFIGNLLMADGPTTPWTQDSETRRNQIIGLPCLH